MKILKLEPGASHDDWPAGLQYLRELQGQTAMSAGNALKVEIKYQLCNNFTLEGDEGWIDDETFLGVHDALLSFTVSSSV